MIKQTEQQIKIEKDKDFVFKHNKSGRIEGTNDYKQFRIISKSPSWTVIKKPKKESAKKESEK